VRTNQAGIEQLSEILAPVGVSVLGYDLAARQWRGRLPAFDVGHVTA
jgi:hypothetical protein